MSVVPNLRLPLYGAALLPHFLFFPGWRRIGAGGGGGGRWRRRGLRRGLWEGVRGLGSSLQRSSWPRGELERGLQRGASGAAKFSGGSNDGMWKAKGAQEQKVRTDQRLKISVVGHVDGRGSGRALAWEREGLGQVWRDMGCK